MGEEGKARRRRGEEGGVYVLRGRRAVVDGCVDSTGEGRPCMHTNDEGGREGRIAGEQLRKAQRRRLSSPPAHAGRVQ